MGRNALRGLLRFDLRCGMREAAPRLGLAAGVWLVVWGLTYLTVLIGAKSLEGQLTFGENLLCMWRGMLPYVPKPGEPFDMPADWLAALVACSFATSGWVSRDLGGMGAHLMAAGRSRVAWWTSKCVWACAVTLACWLVPAAIALVTTLVQGGALTLGVRPAAAVALKATRGAAAGTAELIMSENAAAAGMTASMGIGSAWLATLPALAALLLLQTAVELAAGPALGMGVTAALGVASAYLTTPWLLGNALMLARCDVLLAEGFSPATGALLALGVGLAAVAAGLLVICNKDLLGRREGDDR